MTGTPTPGQGGPAPDGDSGAPTSDRIGARSPDPDRPAPEPDRDGPAPESGTAPDHGQLRRRPALPSIRSRWMWLSVGLLGLALLAWVVVASISGGRPQTGPSPSATATSPDGQATLLIQVRNDADVGANNAIVGVGAGRPAAQVLVPSRLLVDVPASGQQTLGRTATLLGRASSQDALSDLLALRIDGTLSLARLALAGMVDYVGGVTVEVDRPITVTDPRTDEVSVVVPAGQRSLDGTQAAAYALAWLPGEPEGARLARFSSVLTQTVAGLPDDPLRVEQMLTSLGGSARTTTSTEQVADFLVDLRAEILADRQQVQELPTKRVKAAAGLSVVRADLAGADEQLRGLLPDAVLSGAEATPRVLVTSGVATAGATGAARERIVREGLVYINGGNAATLGRSRTRVLVRDHGAEAIELGEQVAEALDVPASAVRVSTDETMVTEVSVVLGKDFEP